MTQFKLTSSVLYTPCLLWNNLTDMFQISANLFCLFLLVNTDWKIALIIAISVVIVVVVLAVIIGALVGIHVYKRDSSEYVNSIFFFLFYFSDFITLKVPSLSGKFQRC